MQVIIAIFILGFIAGLRSMTAPALLCWAAHLGWLPVAGTKLAFLSHPVALILVTLLALGELVADKLPNTPARTAPVGLIARIVLGGACGAVVAIALGMSVPLAIVVACAGAMVGTFGGYHARHALVSRGHLPDFIVALGEDLFAVVGGLLLVSHHFQG